MSAKIEQLDDGIYFGLDEAEYHGQNRLSSSGVQNLLVSPATFWADSWLNPDRETDEEKETTARIAGSAYHMARLQPELFGTTYTSLPDPAEFGDDLLTTHTQIKEALKDLGQPQTKSGEKVLDAAIRLREAGFGKPIWHLIDAEAAAEREKSGMIGLDPKLWREINVDMERLRGNPEIEPYLTEGEAEVSILWTDEADVKWKARLDYLRARTLTDVKTFDNSMRKYLPQCINDAVRFNRYYIQAFIYWKAAEIVRTQKLRIAKVQTQAQKDLIAAIRESEDIFEYWWVFQEKKGIPNVLARRFRMTAEVHPHYAYQAPDADSRAELARKIKKPTRIFAKAELEVRACRDMFLHYLEAFGSKPWGPMAPVGDIGDEDFPPYWLED